MKIKSQNTVKLFSERFSNLRKEYNLTLKEIADDDNIRTTPQSLSLYEMGKRIINIDLLVRIARFFNVSADYLLGLSNSKAVEADIKLACECTGLSETAITSIKSLNESERDKLNKLFENKKFVKFLILLSELEEN